MLRLIVKVIQFRVQGSLVSLMSFFFPNDCLLEVIKGNDEHTVPSFYEMCMATDGAADKQVKVERLCSLNQC